MIPLFTTTRVRLAVLVAAGALGLAACGGTATKAVSSTAPTTATTAPTTTSTTAGGSGSATTTATTASNGATTTTPTTRGVPACATDGLHLSASGPSNPGAGSATWTLTFTNAGQSPCSLFGYPGVSAIGASGQQIGQPAARTGRAASTVVLQPGQSATTGVRIGQAGNFPQSTCGTPTPAAAFRVYPPGQKAALSAAAASLSICPGSAVQMQVNPIAS